MKIEIVFKTPDVVDDAICDEIDALPTESFGDPIVDIEGFEAHKEELREEAENMAKKFFGFGETVTLVMDTEAGTCVVVPKE